MGLRHGLWAAYPSGVHSGMCHTQLHNLWLVKNCPWPRDHTAEELVTHWFDMTVTFFVEYGKSHLHPPYTGSVTALSAVLIRGTTPCLSLRNLVIMWSSCDINDGCDISDSNRQIKTCTLDKTVQTGPLRLHTPLHLHRPLHTEALQ